MNIYTKTGDKGETSLFGGTRVPKDALRVWCYGTVDEAGSVLGTIHAMLTDSELKRQVRSIQRKLFILSAQLASDEESHKRLPQHIEKEDIRFLERIIDDYTRDFGEMRSFTIPGETVCSSLFHVARTVVRRCERHVVSLAKEEFVCPLALRYINRLSDALYVMAKQEVFTQFIQRVAKRVRQAAAEEIPPSRPLKDDIYERMFQDAEAQSRKINCPISFAVVDEGANLVYFRRQAGALLVSVNMAQKKAYTSAAMSLPTIKMREAALPEGSLYGINTADSDLVVFGGGYPLEAEGKLVGAIGISGGTVEQDEQVAKACVAAFQQGCVRE